MRGPEVELGRGWCDEVGGGFGRRDDDVDASRWVGFEDHLRLEERLEELDGRGEVGLGAVVDNDAGLRRD